MVSRHRILLAALLLGNTLAFAGVDPPVRLFTALLVVALALDMRRVPTVPPLHMWAGIVLAGLLVMQLVPLPAALRHLIQPGFAELMHEGWAPLSLAPWSTLQVAASAVIALGIVFAAARMAGTRTGLPTLLGLLAITGAVLAILGLAAEAGSPAKVLLVRDNTGGGGPYGPFINANHFAQAIELTLPAALVLLVASARHLRRPGASRQRAAVAGLASAVAVAVAAAALLRCGSRGGALFIVAAAVLSVPWWRRYRGGRRWPWFVVFGLLLTLVTSLAWTRLPELREDFSKLLVLEGAEGNARQDLWVGTAVLWKRSPVVGSGLGSYRHAIAVDRPATGTSVLEQAHNDWLEWAATGGLVGVAVLVLVVAGLAGPLRPQRVRRLRFELRYPLAGLVLVLAATALHEVIGFGLQTPLNRYLFATWIGLFWGLAASSSKPKTRQAPLTRSGGGEEEGQ